MTGDSGNRVDDREVPDRSWRARVLWWVGGFVVLAVFLITSPLASTSLIITAHSNTRGSSDMAFSVNSAGTTSALHTTVQLSPGENSLNFHFGDLNFPFTNRQIWNVCDCDAQLTVTGVELHNHLLSEVLPLRDLSASGGMPTLHQTGERIVLNNAPTVDLRPRVAITANTGGFVLLVDGLMLLLAAIFTALVFLIVALLGRVARSGGALGRWMRRLRARVRTAIIDAQSPGASSASAVIRLPTALLVIAVAVLAINLVIIYWGGSQVSIWVDEPIHVQRLVGFFERGWYVPDANLADGQPNLADTSNYVYGTVGEMFGHFISVLMGADPIGNVAVTQAAYASRHLSVAILATGAIAASAATVRVLLRSWRWGIVAAAILSAIPTFAGQSMFNPKDIAVAAGYSIITLAFVLIGNSATLSSRLKTVGAAASLVVGSVLMVGTRMGTWPVLAATLAILVLAALLLAPASSSWSNRAIRAVLRGGVAVVGEIVAFVILICIYPKLFGHPLTVLRESFSGSAEFHLQTYVRSAHRYIPSWLIIEIPTLMLVIAAIGLAFAVVACVRVLIRRTGFATADMALAMSLVGAQLLLIPAFSFVERSVLYDGLRQLLFIMPALAIMATIGIAGLVALAGSARRGRSLLTYALVAVAAIVMVLPTVEQAMLFPYAANYVTAASRAVPYTKSLTGLIDPGPLVALGDGSGVIDTALRQVAPYLRTDQTIACLSGHGTLDVEPSICFGATLLVPFASQAPTSGSLFDASGNASFLQSVTPLAPGQPSPPERSNCRLLSNVTRPTLLGPQTILSIYRCPKPDEAIAVPSTLSFARGANRPALFSNWSGWDHGGVWSLGTRSALQITVPTTIKGDLELKFTGYRMLAPGQVGILRVIVNGASLATTTFATSEQQESTTVLVPRAVADRGKDGQLSIQFDTPDPQSNEDIYGGGSEPYLEPKLGFLLETMSVKEATNDR